MTKIVPPAAVNHPGVLDSDTTTFAWDELQGFTLAAALRVDIVSPGSYESTASLVNATIPAGTVVDSHFVNSARIPMHAGITLNASLTFPTDILGIVERRAKVIDSNYLGAPGTDYFTSSANSDFDLAVDEDKITLSSDKRTITYRANGRTGADVDQLRVVTQHDTAPTVNAGGPYAGTEGSPITLHGTATDPDNDPITTSWSFTVNAAKPGTVCTPTGATTLTPTLTCDDDAVVTASLTVSDPYHPPTVSNASVTVANVAPVLGALTVPNTLIPLGSPVNVSAAFTDVGTHDTHTATIDWGDTTSSSASITETNGSGSLGGSHVYSSGSHYTITVTLFDDDNGISVQTATVDVKAPPTVDAGGPYSGNEGAPIGLVGSAVDPDNLPLATTWTFTPISQDAGTTCTTTGVTTLAPTISCNDDAVIDAQISADDGTNPPAVSDTTVTVNNVAPVLGTATTSAGLHAVNANVTVSAPFTDAGTNDTHTAVINWGDTTSSNAVIVDGGGLGSLQATHAYAQPGIYSVSITLSDDNGGTDTTSTQISVNTPPTATAGGPYIGAEGAQLVLHGTANDVDGDALTFNWSFSWTGDPGTQCVATGTATLDPSITCNDDANVIATLTVSDGVNAPVVKTASLTVGNIAPTVDTLLGSAPIVAAGGTFSISAMFSDPGSIDTHVAVTDWGDSSSSSGIVTESVVSGSVTDSHVYSTDGTYAVTLAVTDDDGGTGIATTQVIVSPPPAASAGGPYSGVEGTPVTLTGTASNYVSLAWTYTVMTAPAGTTCSLSNTTLLTTALTCNDNASVTVTLKATNNVNVVATSTATVTINNAAPVVSAPLISPSSVGVGVPVSASATFTDLGTNDTHTATIAWGDATTTAGSVTELGGSGSVSGSHSYATSGVFTVTVTVTDKDGEVDITTAQVTVISPLTASAGGPYSGVEGTPVVLHGTVNNPGGGPVGINWTITKVGPAGSVCSILNATTLTPSVTCNDNATVTATLAATSGMNPAVVSSATVNIANVAPTIASITIPVTPAPVNTPIALQATFADAGSNDTHIASVNWGDSTTSAGVVTESFGAGSVAASHGYAAPGTFTISVTVTDKDGGATTVTATAYVVVYDPSAGFVTGGGWISSPSAAYTPANSSDPDATGKANFGFVSKYLPHNTTPSGNTEFDLKSASFNFKASGMSWLVVTNSDSKAYFLGTGTVNGVAGYAFLVSVIDGSQNADTFRIKVWNTSSGTVAYDNQYGAADAADATQPISGGSIVIHG